MIKYKILMENASLVCVACAHALVVVVVVGVLPVVVALLA
jgi:hypothetical protein